jgi:hypothetical protein
MRRSHGLRLSMSAAGSPTTGTRRQVDLITAHFMTWHPPAGQGCVCLYSWKRRLCQLPHPPMGCTLARRDNCSRRAAAGTGGAEGAACAWGWGADLLDGARGHGSRRWPRIRCSGKVILREVASAGPGYEVTQAKAHRQTGLCDRPSQQDVCRPAPGSSVRLPNDWAHAVDNARLPDAGAELGCYLVCCICSHWHMLLFSSPRLPFPACGAAASGR